MPTPKYMMATTAIHQLGDISRTAPDICVVRDEDEHNYIGSWVTGFGFVGVKFPKSTTRELTDEEVIVYDGMRLGIYSATSGEKSYDCVSISIKN